VDDLDRLPAATFDQRFTVHSRMNGYYRGDDIDAGIIKHSNWLIEQGARLNAEDRKKYGGSIVSAFVNLAEARAGQNMNAEALALLRRGLREWNDVPSTARMVEPEIERYMLVGTLGAPISAPRWLNRSETTPLDLKGKVTLLEFSAHWCGPCRESYPGILRLRDRFAARGFQVVLATQLYGFFQSERPLAADAEVERDRAYFAEPQLNVPIAIGAKVDIKVEGGKTVYLPAPDPNDEAYKVGGIPQIQLIDKHGRIRLIMVGYDDANEEKLARIIEGLLAER
jgi:thiol-disulfide isomerase/thioredoxin